MANRLRNVSRAAPPPTWRKHGERNSLLAKILDKPTMGVVRQFQSEQPVQGPAQRFKGSNFAPHESSKHRVPQFRDQVSQSLPPPLSSTAPPSQRPCGRCGYLPESLGSKHEVIMPLRSLTSLCLDLLWKCIEHCCDGFHARE